MAKKKTPPEPVPPGERFVRVQISQEHQDGLRAMAAEYRMSMAAMARTILIREIEAWQEGKAR